MAYSPNIANLGVYPAFSEVLVYSDTSGSDVLYSSTGFAGIADGNYETVNGWNWYRITPLLGTVLYGWVREDSVQLSSPPSITLEQAQARLNLIIDNNARTVTNLLISAQACKILESRGVNVENEKNQIRNLYARVNERNQSLINDKQLSDIHKAETSLTGFSPALLSVIQGSSLVGAIWVPVVVIAVLVIGAGAVVYYAAKKSANESSTDYSASDSVKKKIYSKLTDEEIALLENDINKQLKGNYQNGYWKGTASISKYIQYGAIALGIYLIYDFFFRRK